jgi:methylated-DNA-[protein]-cysteine S-methyltransferase
VSSRGKTVVSDTGQDEAVTRAIDTQVGRLRISVTAIGLYAVQWIDPRGLLAEPALAEPEDHSDWTASILTELTEYFNGGRAVFDVPLDWRGLTSSQLGVLRTLFESVPFGATLTYGELAARSGTTVPARGIGAIMGANRLPIVVPCHRVLAADGLGGYSGGFREENAEPGGSDPFGLETKRWLLTFEGALPPTLGWDPAAPLTPSARSAN